MRYTEYHAGKAVIKDRSLLAEAMEKLARLEDAEDTNVLSKWIPCTERMPDAPLGCLVTVMDCEPCTGKEFETVLPYHVGYDGRSWNDADGKEVPFEVIAWMPLPEPHREEEKCL